MRRGNRHVHRATYAVRKAFGAHSDHCEWPEGCGRAARWYYTSVRGRWSLCDRHTPTQYRTDPIDAAMRADEPTERGA